MYGMSPLRRAQFGIGANTRLVRSIAALFAGPAISSPGRAGSKNGSVTWSGGRGGQVMNPYCGRLQNENLCLWSQDFSQSAWTKTNVTLTGAQLAPDGTYTAFKFVAANGLTGSVRQPVTKPSVASWYSEFIFVKADARTSVKLELADDGGGNSATCTFDLSTGLAGTVTNAGTFTGGVASMVSIGGGWYQCILSALTGAENTVRLRVFDGTAAGDGASGFYWWASKLETGNVATDYYPVMGTALGPIIYSRQAMPGFSVPRVPQKVWNGSKWLLDAPFRHDFRIGQNMLVNSAWDGAVAGDPGTDPTGWTALDVGDGTLAVPAAGQVTFVATNATDQRGSYQQVTVAANTLYFASARVTAMTGGPLKVSELITWGTIPAGAAVTWHKNGVLGDVNTTATVGDTIAALLTVAATAGTGRVYVGAGVTGTTTPASSVTLTEPQCEPGTVRSVYTPTTTAAISAPVCEPVKSTEDGIFCMFHAQGARTNLVPAMTSGSGATTSLVGLSRTITEDAANTTHSVIGGATMALADGTTYIRRCKVRRVAGVRHVVLRVYSAGGTNTFQLNIDFTNKIATGTVSGTPTSGTATYTETADGYALVSCTFTSAAWGGAATCRAYIVSTSGSLSAYQGDGTSSVECVGDTIEAATFPGLPLGEAVALTAQGVLWNLASLTSATVSEITAAESPYLWSAGAGAAPPAGASFIVTPVSIDAENLGRTTNDTCTKVDSAAGTQNAGVSGAAEASGVVRVRSQRADASGLYHYSGAALVGSDLTFTAPWVARSVYKLAVANTGASQWFGGVAPLLFNGRTATDAERALLALSFARTLSFLA